MNRVNDEIDNAVGTLEQLVQVRDGILSELGQHETEGRFNVAKSVTDRVIGSIAGAVKTVLSQLKTTMSGVELVKALEGVNIAIDEHMLNDVEPLLLRSGDGHNEVFKRLIDGYGNLTPYYRGRANYDLWGKGEKQSDDTIVYDTSDYTEDLKNTYRKSLPNPDTITVSKCANPSGECYGYYLDSNEHLKTCQHKHGVSGETGVTWWQCDSTSCTRSSEHYVPCRGGCRKLMPPPTVTYHPPAFPGNPGWTTTEYHDHEAVCQKPIYSIWNGLLGYQARCGKKYFTCQVCPHRASEGVFYNRSDFEVYHDTYNTLVVKILKEDLYWVSMKINGQYATSAYPHTNGEAILRKTFESTDRGNHSVTIDVFYNSGNSSTEHSYSISVE